MQVEKYFFNRRGMNPSVILAVGIAVIAVLFSNKKSKEFINSPADISEPGSGAFFDGVAHRYDLLNRVISLGLDNKWREEAIRMALPALSLLDVSTGTADLAIAVGVNRSIEVVGIDPSSEMLARGREKLARAKPELQNVKLIKGVAEALPFDAEKFDAVVVAFGVRNFQDRAKGISEMVRVLKVGGRLVVLELSMPEGKGFKNDVARIFISRVMPKLAALVSGNPSAYRYLSDSMRSFPSATIFKNMLGDAGLSVTEHRRLSPFGLGPNLYTAVKNKAA